MMCPVGSETTWADESMVDLGQGLRLPGKITHVELWRGYRVTAEIELRDRYHCVHLEVDAVEKYPEVIESVPVNAFVLQGAWEAITGVLGPLPPGAPLSNERARHASFIYRAAELLDMPPRKAVAGNLRISTSTAGRLLGLARALGYLEDTEHRGGRPRLPVK